MRASPDTPVEIAMALPCSAEPDTPVRIRLSSEILQLVGLHTYPLRLNCPLKFRTGFEIRQLVGLHTYPLMLNCPLNILQLVDLHTYPLLLNCPLTTKLGTVFKILQLAGLNTYIPAAVELPVEVVTGVQHFGSWWAYIHTRCCGIAC